MGRTKQIKPVTQVEFQKKTMTDENGKTFVEISPGNWIDEEIYKSIKLPPLTVVECRSSLQKINKRDFVLLASKVRYWFRGTHQLLFGNQRQPMSRPKFYKLNDNEFTTISQKLRQQA